MQNPNQMLVGKKQENEKVIEVSTDDVPIVGIDIETFKCPITNEFMEDSVTAADGHSYERKAIEEWLKNHATSPMTNEPLAHTTLIENITLRNIIKQYRSNIPEIKRKQLSQQDLEFAIQIREKEIQRFLEENTTSQSDNNFNVLANQFFKEFNTSVDNNNYEQALNNFEKLVDATPKINKFAFKYKGMSVTDGQLLHFAIMMTFADERKEFKPRYKQLIQKILENGGNINASCMFAIENIDFIQITPLNLACLLLAASPDIRDKEDIIDLLIKHHAKFESNLTFVIKSTHLYMENATFLHFAIFFNYTGVVKLLLAKGANFEATCFIDGNTEFKGVTPLYVACMGDFPNKEIIQLLVEQGANIKTESSQGKLFQIIKNPEIIELIKNLRFKFLENKCSELQQELALTEIEMQQLFKQSSSSESKKEEEDDEKEKGKGVWRQLFYGKNSSENNANLSATQPMVKKFAQFFQSHDAAKKHNAEVVEMFMKAALNGDVNTMLELCTQSNIDINAVDDSEHKATALHHAASMGCVEAVNFLLAQGADAAITDAKGDTALDWAKENQQEEIIMIFLTRPENQP